MLRCEPCNYLSIYKNNYNRHLKTKIHTRQINKIKDNILTCNDCYKTFSRIDNLKRHLKKNNCKNKYKNKEQKLICPLCKKIFSRIDGKTRHMKTVCKKNNVQVFKCMDCNKIFSNTNDMEQHMKIVHINPILFNDR